MSFLDIKDPAERATLVKEYVTAMKTVKQRNMMNREMKLAIGDELQTIFHPIVNATKQAAEETRKESAPMKETFQFLHLHNSYLLIEGDVLKADNTRYAYADLIGLTNNGLLYLFSSLMLTLEHVNYPGQTTSLRGLASYSSTYYKGCGLAQGWFPDINTNVAANNTGFYTRQGYLISNPNPKGSFQCAIPMRHIRFCG